MNGLQVNLDELRVCASDVTAVVDALAGIEALTRDLAPDTGRRDSSIVAAGAAQTISSELGAVRGEVASIADRVTACADAYLEVDARAGSRLGGG